MDKIKKIFISILCLILCLCQLMSCSDKEIDTNNDEETTGYENEVPSDTGADSEEKKDDVPGFDHIEF